jgi:hypothetical protein
MENSSTTCKNFIAGACKFGTNCRFAHVRPASAVLNRKTKPCTLFQIGSCTRSDAECNFRHDAPPSFSQKTQLQTTKTQLCNKHKQQMNQLHKISVNGV